MRIFNVLEFSRTSFILTEWGQTPQSASFVIAEINPKLDMDNRTVKLGAAFIVEVIDSVLSKESEQGDIPAAPHKGSVSQINWYGTQIKVTFTQIKGFCKKILQITCEKWHNYMGDIYIKGQVYSFLKKFFRR